ncbi:MAG: DoxX family protein [Bacteroidota bacterium]
MSQFFSTKYRQGALDFSLFLLRLTGGGLMVHHGFDKLIHFQDKVRTFPDPIHIGPTLTLTLVIFAEFFCGVMVTVGLLTRLAVIPLVISSSIELLLEHKGRVFTDGEPIALFLTMFLCLLFTGAGKFSLDRLIGK